MKTKTDIKSRVLEWFKSLFTREAKAAEGGERILTYDDQIKEEFESRGYRLGDDMPLGMERDIEDKVRPYS